jgi:phage shock protein C
MAKSKKLFRSEKDKVIAGVCAGLADYFDTDPALIRILFLAGFIFGASSTFWIYIILWIVLPTESNVSKLNSDVVKENVEEIKTKVKAVAEDVKDAVKPKQP